jgi:hypothetical protein
MSRSDVRMNHDYITDQDLVGRYMAGTLPNDERVRFEAHFVDCPRCLDALEDVEPYRNALRAFASEAAVAPAARVVEFENVRPGVAGVPGVDVVDAEPKPKTARKWMQRVVGLAATVVIAAGIVDALRMRREAARARAAADVSERELRDSEQRARDLRAANAARARQVDAAALTGALVFPLVKTRGAGSEPPQNRVAIPGDAGWIVLLADLNAPSVSSAANRYRATIDTADGGQVWSNDRVTPSPPDAFGVAVPSRLLPPGDYALTLDEQPARSDAWRSVGRYTFRVVPR